MLDHHAGPEHNETYSAKNGIGYGMFGGFIAIVASAGIILWIPVVQGLPTGAYVHALGTTIVGARNRARCNWSCRIWDISSPRYSCGHYIWDCDIKNCTTPSI